MNIVLAKEAIRVSMKTGSHGRPVMLSGPPGVGKSTIFRQLVRELSQETGEEWGLIIFKTSTSDPSEAGDLKLVVKTEDGARVVNAPQDWVPTEEAIAKGKFPKYGIVLCDEILDGSLMMQSVLQGFVLDRELGSAQLAPGWYTAAASNRRKDNAAAGRMSTALARRYTHITIESDLDTTVAYAYRNNWHPLVPAFLRFRPQLLNTFENAKKQGDEYAFANECSWEFMSEYLYAGVPSSIKAELYAGVVGRGPAGEFLAFELVYNSLPDMDKLRKNPGAYPVPTELSVLYATLGSLCAGITKKDFIKLWPFVKRTGPEYITCFVRDCVRQHDDSFIKANPAWDEYVQLYGHMTY